VRPQKITIRGDDSVEVVVHQVVKDLEGKVLFDGNLKHIYQVENDLLLKMDIEND